MIAPQVVFHPFVGGLQRCAVLTVALLWTGSSLAAESAAAATRSPGTASAGVILKVLNREVMVFRTNLGTYSPEQRAAAAEVRIEQALRKPGGVRADSQLVEGTAEIRVHGQTVFFILPKDVFEIEGETFDSVVRQTVRRLDQAVAEAEELRDHESLLKSAVLGILATLLLIGFLWLLARNRRWVESRLIRSTAGKADQIKSHSLRLVGLQNLVAVLRGLMTTVFWAATAMAAFLSAGVFAPPVSAHAALRRAIGGDLFCCAGQVRPECHSCPAQFGYCGGGFWPRAFCQHGGPAIFRCHRPRQFKFSPRSTTAPIAQRLSVVLIWITAIIVAFPYIPGHQTPAFRGITVLAGLMISLGAGNSIAQLVGGLVMVYNRTCRPGDFVRVGEHEGTITTVGFFSSRLVTGRNEEIVLPNSQISDGT